MPSLYVPFGFPDTVVPALGGFDLSELVPIQGFLEEITIEGMSEFMEIQCFIDSIQVLPVLSGINIRGLVKFAIGRPVNEKQRAIVRLANHDVALPHTPTVVFEFRDVGNSAYSPIINEDP